MYIFVDKVRDEKSEKSLQNIKVPNYGSVIPTIKSTPRSIYNIIEPVIFLTLTAQFLSETVIANLLVYHTCRAMLILPDENCTDPIPINIETLIQPTTSNVIMGRALLQALGYSCLALVVGPWSDVNGRKPLMITAMLGTSVTYFCLATLAIVSSLHPYVFLIASVPLALSGGTGVVLLLAYCYVGDVTDENTRPYRMSLVAIAQIFSPILGTLCSPLLLAVQHTSNPYPLVFFISASLGFLTTIYTVWFIQESVDVCPNRETSFFVLSHIKNFTSTCFKHRKGHGRTKILLIIVSMCLIVFKLEGEAAVTYLATRVMFSWQLHDFTMFTCFSSIILGFGSLIGVWLFNTKLGLPNMAVSTVVLGSHCAQNVLMGLASSGIDFYHAVLVGVFFCTFGPLCRTELSHIVSKEELGKVYGLLAFLEFIAPGVSAPLYNFVYRATFQDHPHTIYWLSAGITAVSTLFPLVVFGIQKVAHKNNKIYSETQTEQI